MSREPMRLFQFWDRATAPPEVETLMATWATEPGFAYERYDDVRAAALIADAFGREARTAYADCAVPAMRADVFRLAALVRFGGAYADADTRSLGDVASLVGAAERGVLFVRHENVANDFLAVREADDPLMRRAFETALANIRTRSSNNVWKVTGPGILTQLHRSEEPADRVLFDGFDIITVRELKRWVEFEWTLDYKQADEHWTTAMDQRSIFRSGSGEPSLDEGDPTSG